MTIALTIAALLVLAALTATIQGTHCAPPTPEPEPAYVDECETCGRRLTADECHVLRSSDVDDVERELVKRAGGFGGTYMSATYCAEHYPQTLDSAS